MNNINFHQISNDCSRIKKVRCQIHNIKLIQEIIHICINATFTLLVRTSFHTPLYLVTVNYLTTIDDRFSTDKFVNWSILSV